MRIIPTMPTDVNRVLVLLPLAAACHLGRPPAAGPLSVGRVEAAAAEPGLGDALARGIAEALAARGALGPGDPVDATAWVAADDALGGLEDGRALRRLVVRAEVRRAGARPRVVELEAAATYAVDPGDPLGTAAGRAAAAEAAAREIAGDAVDWLLYGRRAER